MNINTSSQNTSSPVQDSLANSSYSTLLLIFYVFGFIIGCTGNFLVLRVVWNRRHQERTSDYFLAQLALSDILLILANNPCEIIMVIFKVPVKAVFLQRLVCNFVFPFQTVCLFLSVYCLTCVAYERYITIVHKFKRRFSKKLIYGLSGLSWILSVFFSCPLSVVNFYDSETLYCQEDWDSRLKFAYTITLVLSQYLCPLIIITYFYSKTALHLRRTRIAFQNQASLTTVTLERRRKQNVYIFKMFFVLVVVFAICFLPNQVVYLWSDLGGHSPYEREIFLACLLLVQINSSINPVVYGLWGEFTQDWRRCKSLFCTIFCKKRVGQYNISEVSRQMRREEDATAAKSDQSLAMFVSYV